MSRSSVVLVVSAVCLLAMSTAASAGKPGQGRTPIILNATVDLDLSTVWISGANLHGIDNSGNATEPYVTLNGNPLLIMEFSPTQIEAQFFDLLPAATYLLTAAHQNDGGPGAVFHLTVGAVGPPGPVGPAGPPGTAGPPGPSGSHEIVSVNQQFNLTPGFVGELLLSCADSYTSISGGYLLVSPGIPTWTDFHQAGSFKVGDSWKWKFWNPSVSTTFVVRLEVYCVPKVAG